MNKQIKADDFKPLAAMLAFNKIAPGHTFPGGDVHARRTNRDEGVAELAKSIKDDGVLQSLLVCPSPDATAEVWYVIDGNRRLAALELLLKDGRIKPDHPVPVIVRDGVVPGTGLALSLVASIHNLPLHIVDRYEAFKALAGSDADVAARFCCSERVVVRARALGALSPMIRDDWRAGIVAADVAQAMVQVKSHKEQEKLYEQLKKQNRLSPGAVRSALGFDNDAASMLKVVGIDAYVKAGGKVTEDLFGDSHIVSDTAKLGAMLEEVINERCNALMAEGWMWAMPEAAAPQGHYGWKKAEVKPKHNDEEKARLKQIHDQQEAMNDADAAFDYELDEKLDGEKEQIEAAARLRSFDAATKRSTGCIVGYDDDEGGIVIRAGLVRPKSAEREEKEDGGARGAADKTKKTAAKAKPAPKSVDDVDVSAALIADLAKARTRAAARAIALEPDLALAAIVAGFAAAARHGTSPVCVGHEGEGDVNLAKSGSFATLFEEFRGLKRDELLGKLAHVAGAALSLRVAGEDKSDDLLVDTIADKAMQLALKTEFDPKDYFARVPKALCLLALKDMLGESDPRTRPADKSKAEIASVAASTAGAKGWLPPELRTGAYTGPGSKATGLAKKTAAAKPTSKKGGKK